MNLRTDHKAIKRQNVARAQLAMMPADQLASVTASRLKNSFGLTDDEASRLLSQYQRRSQ